MRNIFFFVLESKLKQRFNNLITLHLQSNTKVHNNISFVRVRSGAHERVIQSHPLS